MPFTKLILFQDNFSERRYCQNATKENGKPFLVAFWGPRLLLSQTMWLANYRWESQSASRMMQRQNLVTYSEENHLLCSPCTMHKIIALLCTSKHMYNETKRMYHLKLSPSSPLRLSQLCQRTSPICHGNFFTRMFSLQ